jgi:3-phenylpropionate/trans-cinnamate dioxygenase ferredoxin reductase subunit
MPHYEHLIIGGGMAGDAAAKAIVDASSDVTVAILCEEPVEPYRRPPLSKALWKGKPEESIWLNTAAKGVVIYLGRSAVKLEPNEKAVTDDQGTVYTYDKLLLATGGSPRRLQFDDGNIIYYRTHADYRALRELAEKGQSFVVLGGGFIGSEIAAALAMNGKRVTLIFPEKGISSRIFPQDLSVSLNEYYLEHDVQVIAEDVVSEIDYFAGKYKVHTLAGREVVADGVVAGLGIDPNTKLAEQAELAIADGIKADSFLRTSHEDIYTAGDCANFINPALGKRIRVEHEDNALTMGASAGRNMLGANEPYTHLPFFYSDLFDIGYEAVGELNSRLDIVSDWIEPYAKGVVYYLDAGRVIGVLLWNVWAKIEEARALISEPGPFEPADLKGRISTS